MLIRKTVSVSSTVTTKSLRLGLGNPGSSMICTQFHALQSHFSRDMRFPTI